MRIFDRIGAMLNRKSTVQMVADDPQMAAEILLLIRTMFADGEMLPEEISTFKQMCKAVFGIEAKDVPEVIRYLKSMSYETSFEQAAELFADMPRERKTKLMSNLLMMAMADAAFHEKERVMLGRVAELLGFSEEEIKALV